MPITTYTTIQGEIVSENRNGVKRDYVPDPLGSPVALLDQNQQKTDTFSYWPFGEEKNRTGTTPTPFRFLGAWGYRRDSARRSYVRARYLDVLTAQWLSRDLWWFADPELARYTYADGNPYSLIDPSGAQSTPPAPPHPCDVRTKAYCDKAIQVPRNPAFGCICEVAKKVCSLIKAKRPPGGTQRWFECMNHCMFAHWRKKDTPDWQAAYDLCTQSNNHGKDCCVATIVADQKAREQCMRQCGPAFKFPEELIRMMGIAQCCPPELLNPDGQSCLAGWSYVV